jgi:DNA-binding PadR family transcriptional regulator
MSLMHAILGFLSYAPRTGYELKTECFDQSVAHFWPADQSQIYRTLDKMTEQGLTESRLEIQEDRPNRKVYHITEAGRTELTHWLQTFHPLPDHREPFLVQLYFAAELPNTKILALIQQQAEAHQQVLDTYEQIEIPSPDSITDVKWKRWLILAGLTLDMGKRLEKMYGEWLDYARETVKNMPAL